MNKNNANICIKDNDNINNKKNIINDPKENKDKYKIRLTFVNSNKKYNIDAFLEDKFMNVIINLLNKYRDIDKQEIYALFCNEKKIETKNSIKENGIKDGDIIIMKFKKNYEN